MRTSKTLGIHFWVNKQNEIDGKVLFYVRINIDQKCVNISLKRNVPLNPWDFKQRKMLGNSAKVKQINEYLSLTKSELYIKYQTYGFKNIIYSGPIFEEYTKEKNRIKLHFDYAASGLKADGDVKGFEVIEFNSNGAKKPAKPLAVNIDGTDLVISTENLVSPFILRYGWGLNMGNTNLFDKEGLPASPFRILVK